MDPLAQRLPADTSLGGNVRDGALVHDDPLHKASAAFGSERGIRMRGDGISVGKSIVICLHICHDEHMTTNTETKCTCTDPAVACPSCLAKRDRNGWPKNWQQRMGSKAAVAVVTTDGYAIGYADENVAGYTPTTYTYDSYDEARLAAQLWNERAGLSPQRASEIVLSTMAIGQ